jgi:hypothetical protein
MGEIKEGEGTLTTLQLDSTTLMKIMGALGATDINRCVGKRYQTNHLVR